MGKELYIFEDGDSRENVLKEDWVPKNNKIIGECRGRFLINTALVMQLLEYVRHDIKKNNNVTDDAANALRIIAVISGNMGKHMTYE